jgi:nucleotide-binding universal stress UspA family protein
VTSIRSILLHLDIGPASAARLEFARDLAQRHQAALAAMFVASPPRRSVQLAFAESPAALLQTVPRSEMAHAKTLFDNAAAQDGPPMAWLDSAGTDPVQAFCQQALYADLLVLGQHDRAAAAAGGSDSGFVETVLLSTGKPALVLPASGDFDQVAGDVLIGWNATEQAARAVSAALPWLHAARRVHVLESNDQAAQRALGELDIAQYLQLHGIAPVMHSHRAKQADAGQALLSWASDVSADLLVMGCYGHSRAREFVLGGATRDVLSALTLPVLMVH